MKRVNYDYEVDYQPLILKCGTKLYRKCYENKQTVCQFVRAYPGEVWEDDDGIDPTIDVRVAAGDYNFKMPEQWHFDCVQNMTYTEARAACLKFKVHADEFLPEYLKNIGGQD